MADPLALYTAVMGKLWEEERIRGKSHARIGARLAGRRQGRSYQRTGRLSARNVLKAATGESRSAVFKRIRAGGCKTRASLGNQLAYVNDKAVYSYSTMTNVLTDNAVLSEAQKTEIIDAWSETWRGTTKLGFTSHMLLSFPCDVSADQVKEITLDWAEHFFESGDYGDQWDYVLSVHDDRAHKHAHIILNNRGIENGTWFSCWAEGVMSPQLMREKQAEIAEGYGVMLEATTRLERGIFEKTPGIEEIYRAKSEARLPREIAMTPQERAIAKAQVVGFAKDYADLADLLDRMDQSHLARTMRGMAATLGSGTPYKFSAGEIDMETIRADIKTVGDAIDYAEKTIEALRLKAEELDVSDRPGFEVKAAPVIRDLSKMVPDPDLRARFARDLAEPYPPGAGDQRLIAALVSGQDEVLEGLKAYAEQVGLDGDDITARIEAGGTTNYGLAQDWVERDMAAVLAKDGINLSRASEEEQGAALDKVDTFMDGLMERARELGVAVGLTQETEESDAFIDDADIAGSNRGPNSYLQELADMLRDGELSAAQEDSVERTLKSELFKELGEEALAELRRGNYEVLSEALPNRIDQITVTQEFLELTHEETGDQIFTERASALQQDKVSEIARSTNLEMQGGRGSDHQLELRGLDDDMGL